MNGNAVAHNLQWTGRTILLLLAAAFVCLAAGGNAAAETPKDVTISGPVTVEGTVDAVVLAMPPVAVHSLDNPAFTAYQASGSITVIEGFSGVLNSPLAEVPEGTRLVIEYASVLCDTPAGNAVASTSVGATQRTSPTSSVSRMFQIPLNDQGEGGLSEANFVGGLSTRIYSDRGFSGGGVTGGVLRANGTGETSCFFSIAGHTVPIGPPAGGSSIEGARASGGPLEELILPYTGRLPLEALQPPEGTVVKLLAP